jgi:hypothetical protein
MFKEESHDLMKIARGYWIMWLQFQRMQMPEYST